MSVTRRTVTVLFADVVESTALGERLDPERVRLVMTRYFDLSRDVLERYGGGGGKIFGGAGVGGFRVSPAPRGRARRAPLGPPQRRGRRGRPHPQARERF